MVLVVEHLGFGSRTVPYERAWDLQRARHAAVAAGGTDDTGLLLAHEPVVTAV
jgi:lipoate-protein ligase B